MYSNSCMKPCAEGSCDCTHLSLFSFHARKIPWYQNQVWLLLESLLEPIVVSARMVLDASHAKLSFTVSRYDAPLPSHTYLCDRPCCCSRMATCWAIESTSWPSSHSWRLKGSVSMSRASPSSLNWASAAFLSASSLSLKRSGWHWRAALRGNNECRSQQPPCVSSNTTMMRGTRGVLPHQYASLAVCLACGASRLGREVVTRLGGRHGGQWHGGLTVDSDVAGSCVGSVPLGGVTVGQLRWTPRGTDAQGRSMGVARRRASSA